MVKTVSLTSRPRVAYLSPSDAILYVAATDGELIRIDAAGPSSAVIDTTPLSASPSDMVFSEALRTAIEASANGSVPVQLSAITDFAWDRADILVNYKPSGSSTDCPFQWDWSRETRDKLIAGDLLTVIVFLKDGKLVRYLESRRDRADFVDVKNPYTPETAVFRVSPSPNDRHSYTLSPIP